MQSTQSNSNSPMIHAAGWVYAPPPAATTEEGDD
jgi:hypothetical protein